MIIQPLSEGSHMPQQMVSRVERIGPPTSTELETLRALQARTREAHNRPVHVPA